jgi:two-component sensor histidine kinase
MELQSRTIDNPVVLKMIEENQSRIKALALVHERLYQSGLSISTEPFFSLIIGAVAYFGWWKRRL